MPTITLPPRNATRMLLALAWLLLPRLALAADVFVVPDLPVEATADNPAAARDKAIMDVEGVAFRKLLERIALPADQARWPKPDARRLTLLVGGMEFADEKFTANKYLAKITVRFRPAEVRRILNEAGVSFSETQMKPLLVLPVFVADGQPRLWEEPNPWRDAWAGRDTGGDSLVTVRSPSGNLADMTAINAEQAEAGDAAALEAMRARYDAGEVLVAEARLQGRVLSVQLRHYGGDTPRVENDRYQAQPGEAEEALYVRAVQGAVARLSGDWKQQSMVNGGQLHPLEVTVPLGSLEEWVRIRRSLATSAMVRQVDVGSLSRTEAHLTLQHAGEPAALAAALSQQDLELSQSGDGFWTLRLKRNR